MSKPIYKIEKKQRLKYAKKIIFNDFRLFLGSLFGFFLKNFMIDSTGSWKDHTDYRQVISWLWFQNCHFI